MSKDEKEKIDKKEILDSMYNEPFYKQQAPKSLWRKFFYTSLIVSLFAGFAAGLAQNLWFEAYWQPYVISTVNPVYSPEKNKEVLDLNFLLSEEEQQFEQSLGQLRSQIVGFYKERQGEFLESIYLEKDFLGSGMVITSDGWLLTHQSLVANQEFVVLTSDKKVYNPSKVIVDSFNQVALIKINAQNLSPAKFADLDTLVPTQNFLISRYTMQNHGSDLVKSSIQKFFYHDQSKGSDFLLSSDNIDHYLKLSVTLDLPYNGAAVVNDRLEIVGLLFESGKPSIQLGIPGYYLASTVKNFLSSSDDVIRGYLGVHYLNLTEIVGLSDEVTGGNQKGALLFGEAANKVPAVIKGSPAEKAGLLAGDIILKVNNEEVDVKNSLTRLINDYTPGQELTLTVSREGKTSDLKIILGELSN